ncbi:hypothetical protein J3F83DRAFT_650091 [Trichoderma novae-zelandiae]
MCPRHIRAWLAWLLWTKISRGLVLLVAALSAFCSSCSSSSKPPPRVLDTPVYQAGLMPESLVRARRTTYFLSLVGNKSSRVGQQRGMYLDMTDQFRCCVADLGSPAYFREVSRGCTRCLDLAT